MKNIFKISSITTLALAPIFASAALEDIDDFIRDLGGIIDYLTILVAGIALLVFFWGLVKFIAKSGGDAGIEEGKNLMKWGIVALFIMVSIWGIIYFLQDQLGIQNEDSPNIPTFNL